MRFAPVDIPPMELFRLPGRRSAGPGPGRAAPPGGGPAGPGRGGRGQGQGAGVRRPRRHARPQPDGRGRRPHRPGPGGQAVRWGATGPASFDCSGLVRFAYADAGLSLPRTSRQQWSAGRHVLVAELRPGDLVFWAHDPADPATIHHVGMYVGQGLMVHAPHTGALVRVDAVRPGGYSGATRPG